MSNEINDYDSPWKAALEAYFPQFMQLLLPDFYQQIDWEKDYEFLDTELQKIVRDAETGRWHTDKLVSVYKKDETEIWVLIHIEIQGRAGNVFNRRMYRYHYRLSDRFPEQDIASFAVITNQVNCKNIGSYEKEFWGTKNIFEFPVINLQDWRDNFAELEASPNPFSVVILAQLIAHNVDDEDLRFDSKFRLIKLLYQRGYQKQEVLDLFRFIDWMLRLPEELELKLTDEITRFEEKNKMFYVTNIERFAIKRGEANGIAKGKIEGEADTLLKQLKLKFGEPSESIINKVTTADKAQLDLWVERILTADSLQALFTDD
ncbi:MAG: hypothetical protein GQ569_02345 [Methylococcaceae bacterium]|nr:hypothetical protein [Methylococcaceae bacterium]